ncbi:MAG: TonB family protein, partial [Jaaginema sp. PMC 1079.18]|nr:TonB family protein [Jaaginema sp. PMC 1079.18]
MSYADKFKSVIKYTSQPTAIAILGSVGVHAALGALLPVLPIFPDPAPIRRNVSVVELSPGQAQRLPNLDPPPPMPFAGLPNNTQFLPPGDTKLGSNDFFNTPKDKQSVPFLPSTPNAGLGSAEQKSSSVNTPNKVQVRSNGAAQQPAQPNNRGGNRRIPGGLIPGVANLPMGSLSGTSDFQVRTDLSPEEVFRRSLQQNPDESEIDVAVHDGNPRILNPGETETVDNTEGNSKDPKTIADATPGENQPEQTAEERIREQQAIIARIQQQREQNNQNSDNAESWSQATQQGTIQRASIGGQYPQAACASQAQGTAIYSVLVDASGNTANLRQIQGTGNALLNQVAQSQVSGTNFAPKGGATPYYVTVNFRYNPEVCTAQSPSPETQTPPTNNERPAPTPQPENNQRPAPTPQPEQRPAPTPTPAPKPEQRPAPTPQPEQR